MLDDFTKVAFIVSTILVCDVLSLLYFVLRKIVNRFFEDRQHDSEWKRLQTRMGYFCCFFGLLMTIGGAAYFHMMATWTVGICPTMIEVEKCDNAVKTYGYVLWLLILPTLIAGLMISTSIPRARCVLLRQPLRLYNLKHHAISMGLMQATLFLSLPIAYPFLFYSREVDGRRWAAAVVAISPWMIATYEFGVAFWIEGAIRIWMQPQHQSLRPRERARGEPLIPLVPLPRPTVQ